MKDALLAKAEHIHGIDFIGQVLYVTNPDGLKKLCFDLKSQLPFTEAGQGYVVVLAANIAGKAAVAVMLDETVCTIKNLEAPKIIKEHIAPLIKGGGGGQKTLATAGGQDASNLEEVIAKVRGLL